MVAPMLLFADYEPVSVKDSRFGAVGDFATDDTAALQAALDFCLGPSDAPHGTANVRQNKALYIPPGHYKISAPLTVKYLHGGRIIGAGRFVTQIEQATPGASVFVTNGCGYARFEAMRLTAAAGGKSFDLDWDGSAGGPALQSNTFWPTCSSTAARSASRSGIPASWARKTCFSTAFGSRARPRAC